MRLKVKYDFEGEIDLDNDTVEALIEDLKNEGVEGKPTEKELENSLRNLVSEEPEGLVPEPDDLIKECRIIGVEYDDGETPLEIESEDEAE